MILCLGTTPAAQRVMVFRQLTLDAVNRAVTTLDGAAGKSINVAKVLKQLGEEPVATGFLGGDRGEFIRAIMTSAGIEMDFVTIATPTRQCVTVIDEAAGKITELVEESRPVTPDDFAKLQAVIARRVPQARVVIMSGTIAAGGPSDLYAITTRLAHQAGALSIVDAQGAPLKEALAAGPGLVKPNRTELAATVGRALETRAMVMGAMSELHERGAQRVVITAGKEPAFAFDGQTFWAIRSPSIRQVNPIGSGDAFTAALTWRLIRGDDLGEACRWAAATGAANALTWMAGEVRREDVARLARETVVERITS